MLAVIEITGWHWFGFITCVLVFLALDLGVFHRHAHVVRFREALLWTSIWFVTAMAFGLWIAPTVVENWQSQQTFEFITGYVIELSLSMDNVFVIALIFAYFRIPPQYQHRVLFWGILGALLMRGLMIGAGVALITWLNWVLYLFGVLLVYSGAKMMLVRTEVEPEKNRVIRWVRRLYPVTPHLDGQKFTTRWNGRLAFTPLLLVLLMVEMTDLIFAVDSIPAIFAVTTRPFIIFTSNVFAILGLRSLYFVLAGAIDYFRHLKSGLALVLVFIGVKMLLAPHDATPRWFQVEIPTVASLLVVAGIILTSILLSVMTAHREKRAAARNTRG
jgi:TerC family integral membrane protein